MPRSIVADYVPVGSHSATTLGASATALTKTTGADATLLQAQVYNIYFTLDATTPVAAATGFVLVADDPPVRVPWGDNITITVIRAADGAILQRQDLKVSG